MIEKHLFPEEPVDLRNWMDPLVGWGLVLADDDSLPPSERASGADAPEPIQALLASRPGSPVFRVRPDRFGKLRRYRTDGTCEDLGIAATDFGTDFGRIPRYLLLCGSPSKIPWDVQFLLNARFAVGRLDLADDALENYVNALLSDWAGMGADPFKPLVWATSPDEITSLLKAAIARPIYDGLRADPNIRDRAVFLGDAGPATAEGLAAGLANQVPGLIVTTSHGLTGNRNQGPTIEELGLPLDDELQVVRPDLLFADWSPSGAIWYAHACCSAGSSAMTVFHGLFEPDSEVGRMLSAVAALGDQVATLPSRLLGHTRPLRAFIGHVEPTFDWTIAAHDTGQVLTSGIRKGVYDELYREEPSPVGVAFNEYYMPIGALSVQRDLGLTQFKAGVRPEQDDELLSALLGARDRMSTVILGDPTVTVHRGNIG